MTLEEYKDRALTLLGDPYLEIEINDQRFPSMLPKIIDAAFKEIREAIDTPHYQTITYQPGGIDVAEYNVRAILYVMRGDITMVNAGNDTSALLWSPLTTMMTQTINYGYNATYSQRDFMEDYAAAQSYRQIRNTLAQDLDYTYDSINKKLYVYQQIPQASSITMVYNKVYSDISEIEDPFWINIMNRTILAYCKEVVGRIRSKYKMNSSPYELDGEAILAEGREELAAIREFISENNNIFIPRD